jgi:hypothetical protein
MLLISVQSYGVREYFIKKLFHLGEGAVINVESKISDYIFVFYINLS